MQIFLPMVIYFIFLFVVGFMFKDKAGKSTKDFFLAGRDLPWWLAGTSIVATTFAADTPLAITGIIANKGVSGNWLWFASIFTHVLVVVFFAKYWSRAATITDSELYSLRYSGKAVEYLRMFRASLSGIVINCIVMGWVIRAMTKVSSQFLNWQEISPRLFSFVDSCWPHAGALGNPNDAITIICLIAIVAIYSSMGGLRGVIYTDFIQFAMAVGAGVYFAFAVWAEVGGTAGLQESLTNIYGEKNGFADLFPSAKDGWLDQMNLSIGIFMTYLVVQSFSGMNVDGGGYIMQRLNSCRSAEDAKKASLLFVILHYLVRIWPWMMVGLAALVLVPIGSEANVYNGTALEIANDRELAYPFLMKQYLSPTMLGIMLTSFLAAFMSTMDTHLNWGASYIVNDWVPKFFPHLSQKRKTLISRLGVITFAILAIITSFQISSIEVAWQWIAALSASAGIAIVMRWFWWRVTAVAEITAMIFGLTTAIILFQTEYVYQIRLIVIMAVGILGMLIGIYFGPKNDDQTIKKFYEQVQPIGVWPKRVFIPIKEISYVIGLTAIVIFLLWLGTKVILGA